MAYIAAGSVTGRQLASGSIISPWANGGTPVIGNGYATTTWQAWNHGWSAANQTTTGTTLYIPAETVWQSWNNIGTAASTQLYIPVWGAWNEQYEQGCETRAQAEAREQRAAEARIMAELREREWATAHTRARELLLSMLTDEQAASYAEKGWFEVRGSRGGRWRIRARGQAGNVDLMPEIGEEREASFCCHPPGGLPDADAHLAQMLHLVTDEDGFRRTANLAYRRPAVVLTGRAA